MNNDFKKCNLCGEFTPAGLSHTCKRAIPPLPEAPNDDDPFIQIRVWVPRSIYALLNNIQGERAMPLSRLVLYAIDNELDQNVPFNYPYQLDEYKLGPYQEYSHTEQAAALLEFLTKIPRGMGLDQLMLARRDIKSDMSREDLLYAYRELKEKNLIEEYWPTKTVFAYPKWYRFIKVFHTVRKKLGRKKNKRVAGERTWKRRKPTNF